MLYFNQTQMYIVAKPGRFIELFYLVIHGFLYRIEMHSIYTYGEFLQCMPNLCSNGCTNQHDAHTVIKKFAIFFLAFFFNFDPMGWIFFNFLAILQLCSFWGDSEFCLKWGGGVYGKKGFLVAPHVGVPPLYWIFLVSWKSKNKNVLIVTPTQK